jgi:hypothetical protein
MYRIQEESVVTKRGGPQYYNQRGFNLGSRGGFGRGRGRGNLGRGVRRPIICYNCNQPRNLASDFLNPCTTCTYYRALDHVTKHCPQLLAKWQERRNQNQNPNQNVQKISVEKRNEGPRITTITCGGDRIGDDAMNGGRWVD